VAATGVLALSAVTQALSDHLPESKRSLLKPNMEAIQRGAALAEMITA